MRHSSIRACVVVLILTAVPVLASSHPAPTELEGEYDSKTGIFTLSWEYDDASYAVDEYRVYLDGELLGTSPDKEYDDNITGWTGAMRTYQVSAVVDSQETDLSGELRLLMASLPDPFWCPPTGVQTVDHYPFVYVVVNPECLPEPNGSGTGGGE